MKSSKIPVIGIFFLIVICAAFFWSMNYAFENVDMVRTIFTAPEQGSEVIGEVAKNSEQTIENQRILSGKISLYVFNGVTILQFIALFTAFIVLSSIKKSNENAQLKLKQLENADIFMDAPLYIGLFGTISAFLIMTFSPQSSRVIAFSSTIIGIIFSLLLRIFILYRMRKALLCELDKKGEIK